MKVSGYEQLNALSQIKSISSVKSISDSHSVSSVFKSLFQDTVQISSEAIEKLNESRKKEFADKFEGMDIFTADYNDALEMINNMAENKKDAPDLASCEEFYLMMYHKATLDKGLTDGARSQIQNNLEESYVNFMNLRADKEGWDRSASYDETSRATIKGMGDKEYYNSYYTPVFNAILSGDFETASQLRGEWDKLAKQLRDGQINDEDAAKRMKALADAQEQKRKLDTEMQTMKNLL